MNDERVADWSEWSQRWKKSILRQSAFEWKFATEVLQQIPGLDPNMVRPQREFIGNDGRKRHMDFAIEVGDVKIAIELEGWDKRGVKEGKTRREHDEFNRRLHSLSADGWIPFPITNAQFMENPSHYVIQLQVLIKGDHSRRNRDSASNSGESMGSTARESKRVRMLVVTSLAVAVLLGGVGAAWSIGVFKPANPGNVVDCKDFRLQRDAQRWFDKYFEHYGDVAKLDANRDGVVCENLP